MLKELETNKYAIIEGSYILLLSTILLLKFLILYSFNATIIPIFYLIVGSP